MLGVPHFPVGGGLGVDLPKVFGSGLPRLPHSLRIILENVLRCCVDAERSAHVEAIRAWIDERTSHHEVPFQPGRVLMHDTTCGPALVDIAGMRDALSETGRDPAVLNPRLPVNVSSDHSIAVDVFGRQDAVSFNMRREADRNAERFRLMKWAQAQLLNVTIHPPGTGILHTLNLEQLASVVATAELDGVKYLAPDTLIGTDSHTPMINGLGVLGWGVGGLEAEGVMFGLPVTMRIPDVIGVRMVGRLPAGVMATDLALLITKKLRAEGLNSEFVEFYGRGVSTLSVGERAVVANMAPEYGAQTALFPVDNSTLEYLLSTGRSPGHVDLVEAYSRGAGLWFDPEASPVFTKAIEVDLHSVAVSIAGPSRPHDLLSPAEAKASLAPIIGDGPAPSGPIGHGAVAIASVTSCTNTSDPRLTIAAGLVARKAREHGMRPPDWVKTSFSPGSPAAAVYLKRSGLLADLEAIGFGIVGFGCMTCIGNSGPLTPAMDEAISNQGAVPVAVISGNRNFPYRVHPQIRAGFLASPPLVVAYALAGNVNLDILTDSIGNGSNGQDVFLSDLWPSGPDIDAALAQSQDEHDYSSAFAQASKSAVWDAVEAPDQDLFDWDADSTYLRRPPYTLRTVAPPFRSFAAHPILVLGDDITTDHISPAGAIPSDSETGRYLIELGEDPSDLNVYASRRGNYEAMVRGLFTNKNVVNLLAPGIDPGNGVDPNTGERLPLFQLADRMRERDEWGVILAGERYGAGSSRDWAAKGAALIRIRAVIASSFERIHRTNLIGMGILPLRAPRHVRADALKIAPGDLIEVALEDRDPSPRMSVRVTLRRRDGSTWGFEAVAEIETALEAELLAIGGILPLIIRRATASSDAGRVDSFRPNDAGVDAPKVH